MVDMGSTVGLLWLLQHLAIIVGIAIVVRETTVDFRHYRSWSINCVGLSGYCWCVVLVGTVGNVVSSLMTIKASSDIVCDLTNVVMLSLTISLILIGCLGLI